MNFQTLFLAFVASSWAAENVAPSAPGKLPAMGPRLAVQEQALEIDAGQTWTKQVTAPKFDEDERLVLSLRARADSLAKGGGGCNYVLQVLLGGSPLVDSLLKPRLINKPPWFDPPGTK